LESLDSNGDHLLNASDAAWNNLKVWVVTSNSGAGQLESLGQLGITSINLDATDIAYRQQGNTVQAESTFTEANGATGDLAAVDLAFDPKDVASAPTATLTPAGSVTTETEQVSRVEGQKQLSALTAAMAGFAPMGAASWVHEIEEAHPGGNLAAAA
jgi:hypothetical protein